MVTKQSMRGRDFDTRGAITYTFSGQVIETQPTIPAPPSPEPPVTPKVIATVDVVENPQKIVGTVTDGETGDTIIILPKSFEVDGIPQPLDAIDTVGYIGCYTFETLGEHTIAYEFDNPTIIPADQFCQVFFTSIQLVGITSIGSGAFAENLFTNIEIPESVTSIGESAFRGCYYMTTCNIRNGVTSIGDRAFESCPSLSSITIPDSVTSIGESAFSSCLSLLSTIINATIPPTLGSDAFFGPCTIFVPDASVDAYKTAWPQYASRIKPLSSKFFVRLIMQDFDSNDNPVSNAKVIELEGNGTLTYEQLHNLIPETDAETGIQHDAITDIITGNLCTGIGYIYSGQYEGDPLLSTFKYLLNVVVSDSVQSIDNSAFDAYNYFEYTNLSQESIDAITAINPNIFSLTH